MTERPWLDEEPGLAVVWAELARMLRRALARPLLILALAGTLAAVWLYRRLEQPPDYTSTVTYRLIESPVDSLTPRGYSRTLSSRYLYGHVREVVFSPQRLAEWIRKSPLFSEPQKKNAVAVARGLRGGIEVFLQRNYFFDVGGEPVERSAHVAITYHDEDPERAFEIVQELGRLLEEAHQTLRLEEARAQERYSALELEEARKEYYRQAGRVTSLDVTAATRPTAEVLVAMGEARGTLHAVRERVRDRVLRYERLHFQAELERKKLALLFELVDITPPEVPLRRRDLVLRAAALFLCLVPLIALGVGAFDRRIYDIEDVRHAGFRTLGVVATPRASGSAQRLT